MKPWQKGDLVGCGPVYLPDKNAREKYRTACRDARIESAARHTIQLSAVQERREFIDNYPAEWRDLLKAKVVELWENRE
jgi:hypothetical protein